MNASIKSIILFVLIFIGKTAFAQSDKVDSLSRDLKGSWVGMSMNKAKNEGQGPMILVLWRIHSLDSLKKQIEITEFNQTLDGSKIHNPNKHVYKGTYTDSTLIIHYDREVANVTYTLEFQRTKLNGINMLQANANEDFDKTKDKMMFYLSKISDDAPIYDKKAFQEVEVSISTPPPINKER
jgi:hypothetical protein